MSNYIARPLKVDAFQYGVDVQPLWYITAKRKRQIHISPQHGMIVARTEAGQFNFYDAKTFNALFETLDEAMDLNGDGVVDAREKALATEVKKKRKTKKKEPEPETVDEPKEEE